jgi:hypothetical protein
VAAAPLEAEGCHRTGSSLNANEGSVVETMKLSPRSRARLLAVTAVVHVAVTSLTWRDLTSRPARQVRGNRAIWRAASGLNTLGSVAYWLFARRRT